MQIIFIGVFVIIAAVVIWGAILLEKTRWDARKNAQEMPLYRIAPWINGKWSVEKKRIAYIGASTLCMYMPYNWYETKEAAEKDIEHFLNG